MSQALSPTCEKFRVPVELRVSSQVELDFSKRSCEVGEAYSCPTLKSIVVRAQLDDERSANRQATTKFDKQLQRG